MVIAGILALAGGLAVNQLAPSPFSAFATFWVVWLTGYVAFGLERALSSAATVCLPALVAAVATAFLASRGKSSDTLAAVQDGTIIAGIFAIASIWSGWTRQRTVTLLRRVLNRLFERIGRGSYALYLLHYPLLLGLQAGLAKALPGMAGVLVMIVVLTFFIIRFCPWIEELSLTLPRKALRRRQGDTGALAS